MKHQTYLFLFLFFTGMSLFNNQSIAQLPKEQPLWPGGLTDSPIKYNEEKEREYEAPPGSLSHRNRVFSQVMYPTYVLHQPEKGKANGVAIVICPGGGFYDVWFDREGNDFALWLAQYGITSLVLKYRTYNKDAEGFSLGREVYTPHVYADAKQAIHILRSRAEELGLDKDKIGIGGFSAGGALSLFAALEMYGDELPGYAQFNQTDTKPDFVCLIYPGIRERCYEAISEMDSIPPMFIINGGQDDVTPAAKCLKLYDALLQKGVSAELHIYAKGTHGFDSGIGRGHGISMWRESFVAWLKDLEVIKE